MVDLADRWLERSSEREPTASRDPDGARRFRVVAIIASLVGAGVLLGASIRLSGGVLGALSPFVVWGLAPFGLGVFGVRRTRVGVPRSVAVILSSGFGLVVYGDLLWASHLSSPLGSPSSSSRCGRRWPAGSGSC